MVKIFADLRFIFGGSTEPPLDPPQIFLFSLGMFPLHVKINKRLGEEN